MAVIYRQEESRLSQDGFSARLADAPRRRPGAVPGPVQTTAPKPPPASSGSLELADNGDGTWTLVRCLNPDIDDLNIQIEAGSRPVTVIGGHAFENFRSLRRVVLPDGLKRIDEMAFLGCTGLRTVNIPGSVEKIGTLAFARCSALSRVHVGPGVQKIGPSAFQKCAALVRVDLPVSVTGFGGGVFFGCSRDLRICGAAGSPSELYARMNRVLFDAECWREDEMLILSELEDGSLRVDGPRDPAAGRIVIPDEVCGRRVSMIAPKAFYGSQTLHEVFIGSGVQTIGESAFMGCGVLELAVFERGLEEIGVSAFAGCGILPEVVLPHGLRRVGRMAFFGCTRLSFVKMPNDTQISALAFDGCAPSLRVFGGIQQRI